MTQPADPTSSQQPRSRAARYLLRTVVVLAIAAGVFFAGPRNSFGPSKPTPRALPPTDIAALDDWIANSEAATPDIRPGTAKGIVWHGTAHERTPWAVVYLHGFSASRLETAPMAEQVAQALGANLFQSRLSGHGRLAPDAMGEASVQDWLADTVEAVRIARTLGDKVLVIGCSTGATLASWLALTPEGGQVTAQVLISPNFGPRDKRSDIINGPWGQRIALAIQGKTRGWTPADPREAVAWTTQYPTRSLFPMMALVKHVRDSDMAAFKTPVLMLYSEQDKTVDPALTRAVFERIGSSTKKAIVVDYSESLGQHVLAGDIMAPKATAPVVASIVSWVRTMP
jgi:alpha-beta hydrolase superfamily lysophospholipase